VKVNYVCEEICEMQLSTNYGQYAAGPLTLKTYTPLMLNLKKKNGSQ